MLSFLMNTIKRFALPVALTAAAYLILGQAATIALALLAFVSYVAIKTYRIKLNFEVMFKKIPFLGKHFSKAVNLNASNLLDAFYADNKDNLLKGDLKAYAQENYPEEKYPLLYKNIPDDLRRNIIVCGRMPDGTPPADTYCSTAIDDKFVNDSFKKSLVTATLVLFASLLIWNPHAYFSKHFLESRSLVAAEKSVSTQSRSLTKDVWSQDEYTKAMNELSSTSVNTIDESARSFRSTVLYIFVSSHGIITSILFSILIFVSVWRGAITAAIINRGQEIAKIGVKEAVTLWNKTVAERRVHEVDYLKQVDNANRTADMPMLTFGKAQGFTKLKNALNAPEYGSNMMATLKDMCHTIVFGSTGSGKTLFFLLPKAKEIFNLMLNSQSKIGMYVTDGKGVIWQAVKKLADKMGLGDRVVIIGVEEGEYGVDLLNGMLPKDVGAAFASAKAQTGGESARDFWLSSGMRVAIHAATIARAWGQSAGGMKYTEENRVKTYSVDVIQKLTASEELVDRAADDIMKDIDDNPYRTKDLLASINYLTVEFRKIADVTKSGISSNTKDLLGDFDVVPELSEQFCTGGGKNVFDLKDAWSDKGKIVLINLPSKLGIQAKIINIMLKTKFFGIARKREADMPGIGDKEFMIFMSDECHETITMDELTDTDKNFWNIARSTGVIGVLATQTVSTLEEFVGEKSATNLLAQMNNKVVFQVDDEKTMRIIRSTAGKTHRWTVSNQKQNENWETYFENAGQNMRTDLFKPLDYNERKIGLGVVSTLVNGVIKNDFGYDSGYEVDTRFFGKLSYSFGADGGGTSSTDGSELQTATWRRDDKEEAYLKDMIIEDIIDESQLAKLNNGSAFVSIKRSGMLRKDFVTFEINKD